MVNDVIALHGRRKSDEQIEIAAYIAKHKPIDETNIDAVAEALGWLKAEKQKRARSRRLYGCKENRNDKIVDSEIKRLTKVERECREWIKTGLEITEAYTQH